MTTLVLQPRISGTTVTTGVARASYAHVFEPQPERNPKPGAKPKYSISLLIPKSDKATLNMLVQAMKEAGEAKFGPKFMDDYKAKGSKYKKAIRDGDSERDDPAYAGHYFVNCRSNQRPIILARDARTPITNPADFRSGDYCRATINAFAYDNESKGVSFGLIHLQKVESGEPLGATGPAPESVYDAIPGGDAPAAGEVGDDDFPL
jgi:hypothetical protein